MKKFKDLRSDFPMLKQTMHGKPLIYLDSAATTQKPQVVINTIQDFYEKHYGTVNRAIYELALHSTTNYNNVRELVKKFINANRVEEIVFTRGSTDGLNLIASSFGKGFVQPGDEIIITQIEHHSNIVPWQILCQERKAHLRAIPVNDAGEIDIDAFKALLNERTKLVSLAHISNSVGTLHPIKEIITLAHAAGAKVLVDAAQSAPHIKIDVQDLDVDFLVFSGHKAYGPTGVGILYGKYDLLEALPPYQGGGDMISTVSLAHTTYSEPPIKFEAGTPMIAEVIGLGAAIEYIMNIGLDNILEHETGLLNYLEANLKKIDGLRIIGNAKHKGAITTFIVDGIHPLDLGTLLDLKGVALRTGHHCSQPTMERFKVPATSRVSFGLYNNIQDVEQFLIHLESCIRTLRP